MIFRFGKKEDAKKRDDEDEDRDEDEEEFDFVLFQGALNGTSPDLSSHSKLVQAGLVPAKRLVSEALSRRAEMIRVEFKGKTAAAILFVDGVHFPPTKLPPPIASAIVQIMKLLAGLDIRIKDKPQAGGIKAEYDGAPFEIRVNTQPTPEGVERLIIRAQDTRIKFESPKELGFSTALVDKIRKVSEGHMGLIVVAGPPMSGVTSAMIATVRATDPYMYSIYCLADLGNRDLAHVKMFRGNPDDDLTQTLLRAKREDADVLVVEPLNSPEMIKTVLDFADRAALVAEMPARNAADALTRLVHYTGDPAKVAERVRMVLCQMLIRVLCKDCRRAYRPNPKLLAKINLPPETKVLYRPPQPDEEEDKGKGEPEVCERCGGTGYFGRTGLIEWIEMTEGIQKVVRAGAHPADLKAQVKTERMQTHQSDGLRLVLEGTTSLEELQRVLKGT